MYFHSPQTALLFVVLSLVAGMAVAQYLQKNEGERALPAELPARLTNLLLITIILLALALRFWGLDFGLPDPYHPDEFKKAHFLTKMRRAGTLDPPSNLHPPLLLYLSWGVASVLKALELEFSNSVIRNLFAGRVVSAIAGTISVALTYGIGRTLFSVRTGLVAALILAVSPIHVTCSRYFKEDALLVLMVLACTLAVVSGVTRKRASLLYLGGFFAGLSLASKYTGLLSVAILLSSPWLALENFSLRPVPALWKPTLTSLLFVPLGFIVGAPFIVFSEVALLRVWHGFGAESRHAMRGHLGTVVDPWVNWWMFHLNGSIIPGMHLIVVACALVCIGIAMKRAHINALFVAALALLFYLPAEWAPSKPPPQPERYILPSVPFIALLSALMLEFIRERLKPSWLWLLLPLFLILPPLSRTLLLASEIKLDTREQMTNWIAAHLEPQSRILTMGGKVYLPRVPLKFHTKTARQEFRNRSGTIIEKLKQSGDQYLLTTRFERDDWEKSSETKEPNGYFEIEQNFRLVKRFTAKNGSYAFHNPTISLYALTERPDTENALD